MNKKIVAIIAIVVVFSAIAGLVWMYTRPAPFYMKVISRPRNLLEEKQDILALAGQECVFLVFVNDASNNWMQGTVGLGEEVEIEVACSVDTVEVNVFPEIIFPGEVAEIIVIPSTESVNIELTIIITGTRHELVQEETIQIHTVEGEDTLDLQALEVLNKFIPWLESNYTEFYITNETEWTGTIVNPKTLVVMHYLFFSDEWEVYVTWNATIPPNDWARIYLRYRYFEPYPTFAFEISSMQTQGPHVIEVPDWV